MTTFKLPDFESNGGNLLSKFICVLRIRYSWQDRAADLQRFYRLPLVMVWCVARREDKTRARLTLSNPLSFPKRNALRTTGIGFEIAFHQLQSLLVLFHAVRNNAVGGNR